MALSHVEPGHSRNLLGEPETTKSTALVKTDAFEAIKLIVPQARLIAPHAVEGPMTLYCISGRIALIVDEKEVEMKTGDWLYLEGGKTHAVRGIEDAKLILTIMYVEK